MTFRHSVLGLICGFSAVVLAAHAAPAHSANTPPTISGTPATSVKAGATYSFTPSAKDANGDYLRFYVANKPAWATIDLHTGQLTGTPAASQVGTYSNIEIYVSDSQVSTSLPLFNITVTGTGTGTTPTPIPTPPPTGNQPPVISGSPATSVVAGSAYYFRASASDANGDYLRFYIANKPTWANLDLHTGELTGTPSASQVGTYSNIEIYVSDSKISTSLPLFDITVKGTGGGSTNRAPVISGSPPTGVAAGSAYSFQPTASDPDGDALSFTISGKPTWATFSVSKGSLTGTPSTAQVGSYPNIVITASDGKASKSLGAFGITVSAVASSGSANLSWIAPSKNTDGTTLTDLSGFKIYHGTSTGAMTDVRTVSSSGTISYQFTGLASGTHYFAVSAYNAAGVEGARSAVGSKAIP